MKNKRYKCTVIFGDEVLPITVKAINETDARRQLVSVYRVRDNQILAVNDRSTIKTEGSYYKSSMYGRSSVINGRSTKRHGKN